MHAAMTGTRYVLQDDRRDFRCVISPRMGLSLALSRVIPSEAALRLARVCPMSESPLPELGRLTNVDPREVWQHEAHHFTPWLLKSVDVLSDLLGMNLALEVAEHPVGGFSLDLLGRDETTGEVVIVENQLEASDHTHLGQIRTYAVISPSCATQRLGKDRARSNCTSRANRKTTPLHSFLATVARARTVRPRGLVQSHPPTARLVVLHDRWRHRCHLLHLVHPQGSL